MKRKKNFLHSQMPCPYLAGNRIWGIKYFYDVNFSAAQYEASFNLGLRRSGFLYYQNNCSSCNECLYQRVDVKNFKISRSQKRIWRKNADIQIRREKDATKVPQLYKVYSEYMAVKHQQTCLDKSDFASFLANHPSFCGLIGFYLENQLVAASWIDFLPNSISSVYAVYCPNFSRRSLGVFSALYEISLAKSLGLSWYYLGFWVKDSPKMAYKANYKPRQLLKKGQWEPVG